MPNWVVATQLYQWGVSYQQQGQPLEGRLDEVFGAIAGAGYQGIEWMLDAVSEAGTAGRAADLLAKHHLEMVGLYTGAALHEPELARAASEAILARTPFAVRVGVRLINVNPDPIGREKTDEELASQAAALNALGRELGDRGLRLVVHNHDPEMRSGARELRHNLDRTDPEVVGLCLDTHWAYRGGGDPLALIREYAPRLEDLHLRNSAGGVWSESFGEGDIDHRAMAELLREVEYEGPLIVELAYEAGTRLTRTLAENTRLSRQYVRQVFGV